MSSVALYLLGINAATAGAMAYDKWCAMKRRWRVPEATLFTLALMGGSPAMIVTIRYIRHKSSKTSFLWRLYGLMALQVVVIAFGFIV